VIHENSGRFSLYYLTDLSEQRYDAFFSFKDPTTSFLSVNVNGRSYRLGESWSFSTRIEDHQGNPSIVFESPLLLIREVFSLVKTADSSVANGIKITVKVENKNEKDVSVGLRKLIDTHLGEGFGRVPFVTKHQTIKDERIIDSSSDEEYWVSRGLRLSLMGSIADPEGGRSPDFVHFANWKKLYDAAWKAPYYQGRSFNSAPYSIGDSAVCYYYEPVILSHGEAFSVSIFLTTEDTAGFIKPQTAVKNDSSKIDNLRNAADNAERLMNDNFANIYANRDNKLRDLLGILDQYIAGEIQLSDDDLTEIEQSIIEYRSPK
jgi:hypothetical protein